jgi:hypothetical protein
VSLPAEAIEPCCPTDEAVQGEEEVVGVAELGFPRSLLFRSKVDASDWATLAAVADHNAHGEEEDTAEADQEEERNLEEHLTTVATGESIQSSGWTSRIREQAKLLLSFDRNIFARDSGSYQTFLSSLHMASCDTKSDLLVGLPPLPPLLPPPAAAPWVGPGDDSG